MSYKLCEECQQPMLKKGQRRRHPDDYRHARGCPNVSKAEHDATEALWSRLEARSAAIRAAEGEKG